MTTYELLRASHTKRWTIVSTARVQTVAEHSFNVAMVAEKLAEAIGWDITINSDNFLKLQTWALMHDIPEVFTGDLPTPFKRELKRQGVDVEAVEDELAPGYGDLAEAACCTEYGMIVKLADMMEAIWFLSENGLGVHARKVLQGLYDNLYAMVEEYSSEYPNLLIHDGVARIRKEMCI
jgi:5'-deoxynucleotidase